MRVLFVCWGNINRSQIAEAIFNRASKRHRAVSAGLRPRRVGVLVRDEHNNPFIPMAEEGYDLSKATVKRVNRRTADSAGRIVLIFGKGHLKEIPPYLRRRDLEFWEVAGISDEIPFEDYCRFERRRIRLIEGHVRDLVARIG